MEQNDNITWLLNYNPLIIFQLSQNCGYCHQFLDFRKPFEDDMIHNFAHVYKIHAMDWFLTDPNETENTLEYINKLQRVFNITQKFAAELFIGVNTMLNGGVPATFVIMTDKNFNSLEPKFNIFAQFHEGFQLRMTPTLKNLFNVYETKKINPYMFVSDPLQAFEHIASTAKPVYEVANTKPLSNSIVIGKPASLFSLPNKNSSSKSKWNNSKNLPLKL